MSPAGGSSCAVALLSYRSKPHCGGQGVYVRHLSRELVALGHEVEVFSGQPYPDLDEGVRLTKVPSLDLYREPDPFRVPGRHEFRDLVDVEEFLTMCTAGFPEPKTFGTARRPAASRPGRRLRRRARQPGAGHRHARDRASRPPAGRPRSTTRSPSTAASTWPPRRRGRKRLSRTPVVRLPADADARRPQGPLGADPVRVVQARHRDRLRRRPRPHPGDPAGRRRRLPAADGSRGCPAGSWPWPAPTPR